ncbi:MAG: COX15/CtaA family protein [Actinomycetes bacterium]
MSPRTYRRVVAVALALLATIVVTGAAVRLTGSGLGCEDWPNCTSGDFIKVSNPNQAIEQLNRLFTGLVSLGVIAAVLGAFRRRPFRRDLVGWAAGLVLGVIGQIVLGGITVLVDLHPAAVAGHFVLSMILIADAVVLLRRSGQEPGPRQPRVGSTDLLLSRLACVLLALGMVTGPVVTGAGPHAGDGSAPRFDAAVPDVVRIHSLNMWCFLAVLVVLLVRLARSGAPADVLRNGQALVAVLVLQGGIGYLQYELGIPAWLVIFHIAGATAVVALMVWFHLCLSDVVPPGAPPGQTQQGTQEGQGGDTVAATT